MTHFCYTLEEAAQRLNLSETVLVRLSQYFKVPQQAYEASGYLSFKGDLNFTDQDLSFFRQIREELISGKSLEQVKSRLRYETTPPPEMSFSTLIQAEVSSEPTISVPAPPVQQPTQPMTVPAAHTAPLVEMMHPAPYQKLAEKSFARYKGIQQLGAKEVFKNMMKEVGESSPNPGPEFPVAKPHKQKLQETNRQSISMTGLFKKQRSQSVTPLSITPQPEALVQPEPTPIAPLIPEEGPSWEPFLSHLSPKQSFGLSDPMRRMASQIKNQALQGFEASKNQYHSS